MLSSAERWKIENREHVLNYAKNYNKEYYRRNAEKIKNANKEYYFANHDRNLERKRAAGKLRDHGKRRHECALRYARLKLAAPKWADLKAIKNFYLACPEGMHVDHEIPIRGKTELGEVWGLHVLGNLQYLPAVENMRKNRWIRSE